jgi:hypothetical protein
MNHPNALGRKETIARSRPVELPQRIPNFCADCREPFAP